MIGKHILLSQRSIVDLTTQLFSFCSTHLRLKTAHHSHWTHVICCVKSLNLYSNHTFPRMYFKASAVKAALSSPPVGLRTAISSKQSGEDKVVQSIQGRKDHSNTIAKSSMSTETEVSHIQHCPFIGNIHYQTHISTQIFYFPKTSTKKISAGGNVDGLGDSKSSNKEEAATKATEVAGKGHHHGGESIEMNVVSLEHLTSYKLLVSRIES